MSPQQQRLEEANRLFYRAFESLKLEKMQAVWWRGEQIRCVHPGWPLMVGWEKVMRSWELLFTATRYIEFELSNVAVHDCGAFGWVLCQENILSHVDRQTYHTSVLSTNVFEAHDEQWHLVHHHGSQIAAADSLPSE